MEDFVKIGKSETETTSSPEQQPLSMGDAEGRCDECGNPARQFCSSCKTVFYCSKECQKKGWKTHKQRCRPFTLQTHPVFGRYLVASRDIKAGEVILKEAPIVIGPKQSTVPVCLGCHKRVAGNAFCKKCKFPLCSVSCQGSKYHKDECPVLAKATSPLAISDYNAPQPTYECITPLRCLLLKACDRGKWEVFANLQSHLEDFRNSQLYNVNQRNIVDFIKIFLGYKVAEEENSEILQRICGILNTNCFELIHNGSKIRGIYPTSAMLAHNCVPNTKHAFDDDKNIIFRTTQQVLKGTALWTIYTQPLWDTYTRRLHLKTTKYFLCQCKRCSDPTELETELSTLICIQCGGEIRSSDPLDFDADWKCVRCDHQLQASQIKWGNDILNKELRSLCKEDPTSLHDFINNYQGALHPNHRFAVEAKYALVKFYGNNKGFLYKDLTEQQINDKVKWAKELLDLSAILDPGKSLLRGTLLFQLQAATVAQAKIRLSNDMISEKEAEKSMAEAVGHLQEATEILKHEPDLANGGLDDKLKWLSQELEL